jgi:hypothetical protein
VVRALRRTRVCSLTISARVTSAAAQHCMRATLVRLCAALRGLAHSGAAARVRGHVDRADFDAVNREVRADVVEDAARSEPLGYSH